MSANSGVKKLRIAPWGVWMEDGRININTDHGESCTCAERERERVSTVDVPVFIVRLLCITDTHTHSKTGVSGLRHCSICRFTLVSGRY
jgi:predicted ABC-class ATPase